LLPLRAGYLLDSSASTRSTTADRSAACASTSRRTQPHVAALWAVLTRLLPTKAERYDDAALGNRADLTPMEKARR